MSDPNETIAVVSLHEVCAKCGAQWPMGQAGHDCISYLRQRIVAVNADSDANLAAAERCAGERDRFLAELERVRGELALIGERAVVDFDTATIGAVDAAVKEPQRYKDWIRETLAARDERDQLRADLARVTKERDGANAERDHERGRRSVVSEQIGAMAAALGLPTGDHGGHVLQALHDLLSQARSAKATMVMAEKEIDRLAAEVGRLRGLLAETLVCMKEAKRLWAPHTTNSDADGAIARITAALASPRAEVGGEVSP